ncbi:MAG: cupin domain-containing protein [Anaerolineales bacterium]|nr:cupin domain-containing protein [Anaerolineales bacterium]
MTLSPINFKDKFSQFDALWSPKIVAQMNDYHIKLVKIQGEFVWHDHPDTDEVFIVLNGSMRIDFHDSAVVLRSGEMFVVPRGIEHRPVAEKECQLLLIEPAGTVNTGAAGGDLTAGAGDWL